MKTLLVLMMTFSFTFGATAFAQTDEDLSSKISALLDDADSMSTSQMAFKKLITVNALERYANSNINDPKLFKRIADNVETLEQAFTVSQHKLVKKSLRRIEETR